MHTKIVQKYKNYFIYASARAFFCHFVSFICVFAKKAVYLHTFLCI